MAIFGSFYNEFDFEQLGTPENIDDFDQMKFCARLIYFNSKDRGNWFEKVSLQPIWFASKGNWKEYWHLWGLSGLYDKHLWKSSKQLKKHFWVLKCFGLRDNAEVTKHKNQIQPRSFENNSDFKQCFGSFFIDPILSKVIGVNSTQSIKTCFCSFDICTKMQKGWFESDFYGRLGRYRRGAPAIPFNEVKEAMIS